MSNVISLNVTRYYDLEKKLLECRAKHNDYYPHDPRCKGKEHQAAFIDEIYEIVHEMEETWDCLTDEEIEEIDPEMSEEALDAWRVTYEKALDDLEHGNVVTPLPDRACKRYGHVRSQEEMGEPHYRCMECLGVFDAPDNTATFLGKAG